MIIKLESVSEYTISDKDIKKHNKKAHTFGVGVRKGVAEPKTNKDGVIMNSSGSINQGINAAIGAAGSAGASMGESFNESVMNEISLIKATLEQDLKEEQKELKFLRTLYNDLEAKQRLKDVQESIIEIEDILKLIKDNKYQEARDAFEEYKWGE